MLRLVPGADPEATRAALRALGVPDVTATEILSRALAWPDAFPENGSSMADAWRPWRAYAARHLAHATMCPSPTAAMALERVTAS